MHVAHAVADLGEGLRLFRDLLGGAEVAAGEADTIGFVDLRWPGPGQVRLLHGRGLTPWLEGRSGRVHHLAFAVDEPGEIARATPCQRRHL